MGAAEAGGPGPPEPPPVPPSAVAELLGRHGSPLYVYELSRVAAALAELRRAFTWRPLDLHYAIVCNKNRYLVRWLWQQGVGVHANTPGDAAAALAAGLPASAILYSGTNLSGEDFDFLLGAGIGLNLDSLDQLRDRATRGPGEVGLRLLVDGPERPSRIGVAPDELPEARRVAADAGLRLSRLHLYSGTNTLQTARFLECLDRTLAAAAQLPDLDAVDLGGGFGVPYRPGRAPLDLATLGAGVAERLEAASRGRDRPLRLIVEPGRILVAAAGTLYTRVVSVKQRAGRRYLGVDATVANVAVESVYHAFHRVEAVGVSGPDLDVPTDVCGNTTHSRDFLARNSRLPRVERGDVIAVRDVGAYGYAMASHFLNRPRPAEVVLDAGRRVLTTRREQIADLLATQLPEALP